MYQKPSWHFGAGDLFVRKAGKAPFKIATLQGIDVDIAGSLKELQGEKAFAEAVARGAVKITGKIASGRFDHRLVSELFFNEEQTAGRLVSVSSKKFTIPAVTPFTVSVVTSPETFDSDNGVGDEATAGYYELAADTPTAGLYTVDQAGLYTFAEADKGKKITISFIKSVAEGTTTYITNQVMDEADSFELVSSDSRGMFFQLYKCVFSKLSLQRKNEDFMVPNMEFGAFADDVRGVGRMSGV